MSTSVVCPVTSITFQSLQNHQNFVMDYATAHNQDSNIDILDLLNKFNSIHPSEATREFYFYDENLQEPVQLHTQYALKWESLQKLPLIKFKTTSLSEMENENQMELKKERTKQRSILEVLEFVEKWRKLHRTQGPRGKVNLQQAAKLVGISKKSLDDYYCQLRLGEKYNFDFRSNIHEKIGVLRTFVKKNRPKHQEQHKNEKHPKELKIIEEFKKFEGLRDTTNSQRNTEQDTQNVSDRMINTFYELDLNPIEIIGETELQNQFYRCGELMIGEQDPFVPFKATEFRNFNRREVFEFDDQNKSVSLGLLELEPMPWEMDDDARIFQL